MLHHLRNHLRIRPRAGLALLFCFLATWMQAQVSLTGANPTYTQTFNTLATSGTSNAWSDNATLPGWYSNRTVYIADAGTSNSGGLHSHGPATGTTTERALGSVGSGSAATVQYGVKFTNNTGAAITGLRVQYTGEQWRNGGGATAVANTLTFGYKVNAATLTESGYAGEADLNFVSPVVTTTASALDGNAEANRSAKDKTIALPVSLANGESITLRWTDVDDGGSDQGLSIDDLTVSFTTAASTDPALSSTPTGLNLTYQRLGGPADGSYQLAGNNLTPDGTVTVTVPPADASKVAVSVDGGPYGASAQFSYAGTSFSGKTVNVRLLTGLPLGQYTVALVNAGGGATSATTVNGSVTSSFGCDFSNTVISIQCARELAFSAAVGNVNTTQEVTVEGTVTANNFGGTTMYVQDATGGIAVFKSSPNLTLTYSVGQQVRVKGRLTYFFGVAEFSGNPTITPLGVGSVPTPVSITTTDMSNPAYFGKLVTVSNAVIDDARLVFSARETYDFTTSGTGLRVEPDVQELVNSLIVKSPNAVTGILDQNDNDDDPTTGNSTFQVKPRGNADLNPVPVNFTPSGGGNLGRDQTLDVAHWNIEWFGSSTLGPANSGANDATQVANAKNVLKALNADVYFFAEIVSETLLDELKTYLSSADGLNAPFEKVCSPCVSNGSGDAQKVCFIYKTKASNAPDAPNVVQNLGTQCLLQGNAQAESDWSSGRLPFMLSANVTIGGVTQPMKFVGIHAKAFDDVDSYNRRKRGAEALDALLNSTYASDAVVIAGDYNDDLDQSIAQDNGQYLATPYAVFTTQPGKYTPLTLPLSQQGFGTTLGFDNVIDHIVVSNEIRADGGTGKIQYVANSVGSVSPDAFAGIADFVNTTSDHVPVFARFTLTAATLAPEAVALQQGQSGNRTVATVSPTAVLPEGSSVSASANANGVSLSNIQLNASTGVVTADVAATCEATDASFTLTLTYGANSTQATLNVDVTTEKPTVTATATPNPVCEGDTLSLQASATGTGAYTYAWTGPNSFSSSESPASRKADKTDGGVYEVTVGYGSNCTVKASTASVVVTPGSFAGTPSVGGAPVCAGQAVTLNFSFNCPANYTFTAQLSDASGNFPTSPTGLGAVLPNQTNQVAIPSAAAGGTGYRIRVVASDPTLTPVVSEPFRVNALGVVRLSVPTTPGKACPGGALPVTFSTSGECPFPLDNVFTVQLSSATGSFGNPTTLGTAQPGTVNLTLPATLPAGSGYRVRVVSSNPAQTSVASAPFQVAGPSLSAAPSVGSVPACVGGEITVTFSLPAGGCPFTEGNVFTAQLSSAFGSFNNPTALGSVTPGQTTTLNLPGNLAAGTGYRVRMVSSSPALTSVNSSTFQIKACNGRLAAEAPGLVVAPNPVRGGAISCRVSGMNNPTFGLATAGGRSLAVSAKAGEEPGDFVLTPRQALPTGVYVLQASEGLRQVYQRLLVVE